MRACVELACLACLALLGAGCGAAGPTAVRAEAPAAGELRSFTGTVRFEARHPTPTGVSASVELLPARFVEVRALALNGTELGRTRTDERGHYALDAAGAVAKLEVVASVEHDGHDLRVALDPTGSHGYFHAEVAPEGGGPLDVVIGDDGIAGAFHILDTFLRGSLAVRAWTGRVLPPFYAYWARGGTTNWSFYRGEQPAGSGVHMVELLGGDPGAQRTSDTDEHDDAIILHEFGHFVMAALSTDSSPGGEHPSGVLLCPGLAWEEGRATWFATAVLGAPLYQDTIGMEPQGSLRVSDDLERGSSGPRGPGSEDGVAEILWDLADGASGLVDRDQDGVALGPAAVLGAMIALAAEPGVYPAIQAYLRHLVRSRVVGEDALQNLLARAGQPASLLPADDVSRWPTDLALGSTVSAKIDSLTDPTPGGGPAQHGNGQYAVHVYRVHVPTRAWLTADLRIFGTGAPRDHQDLDLELRTTRADLLDGSTGEGPHEAVRKPVEPGWYVLYVRDGGNGTRVGYELRVSVGAWAAP